MDQDCRAEIQILCTDLHKLGIILVFFHCGILAATSCRKRVNGMFHINVFLGVKTLLHHRSTVFMTFLMPPKMHQVAN